MFTWYIGWVDLGWQRKIAPIAAVGNEKSRQSLPELLIDTLGTGVFLTSIFVFGGHRGCRSPWLSVSELDCLCGVENPNSAQR